MRSLSFLLLSSLLLGACASLVPQPFHPQTPDEHAIARTISTFLTAYGQQDIPTLRALSLPDATLDTVVSGSAVAQGPLVARLQQLPSALLRASPKRLVDYQQTTSGRASVTTYVEISGDQAAETTRIRWDLSKQAEQWQIRHLHTSSWRTLHNTPGGGP